MPAGLRPISLPNASERAHLTARGKEMAESWVTLPHKTRCPELKRRYEHAVGVLAGLQHELSAHKQDNLSEDLRWLSDHLRLFASDVVEFRSSMKLFKKLPVARSADGLEMPRVWVLMRGYLEAVQYELSEATLTGFVAAAEEVEPLEHRELWAMALMLKLVIFEEAARRGQESLQTFLKGTSSSRSTHMDRVIQSLRLIGELDWDELIEPISYVNAILREDPAGVYSRMDEITRESYLTAVSDLAEHSHASEIEIARMAVHLAREVEGQNPTDRDTMRRRHVGYYLIDRGVNLLRSRIRYRPSFDTWLQNFVHRYPDEFYIIGIEFISLITIVGIIVPYSHGKYTLSYLFVVAMLLLIPVTQAAVELVNYFITSILRPSPLPKFDFSEGVPADCKTLVTVPTLLINERQIRQLIEDLEVRYLGNQDANIHYALLTDLPDTAERADERDPKIELAVRLIEELNKKYGRLGLGQFYLFHRHRVFNPQEGAWMGWERKRGKLLDLNKLLRGAYDPFPVKAGDMSLLRDVRFVITLDSDTQLPRGSAARMIGTLAHPLNAAVVDRTRKIVTEGYGILQPRVGISIQSAARSRLAALYSGQTGFDIYTRAVSDVYQDLYSEGIFTGKGIYEVDALRQVLELRFPKNTLLSHDLIEGAYARAGLLSDVEVIDDYPSHYSAYNRRKHRWLRGDWQIARWLFAWVPDEAGRLVRNPISLISRWKIFDNLRRSLVEPATFVLFIAGWFFMPGGPASWACIIAGLLFLPGLFQLLFGLFRFLRLREMAALHDAIGNLANTFATVILNIVFLAHQALVALDAIIRTIVRSNITRSRLLEWETATEAELGLKKRTPVDQYLDWMPVLAAVLGLLIWRFHPKALPYAAPVLAVWACSKLVSNWLNRPPLSQTYSVRASERRLAEQSFLKTWRFFVEFSNELNHWLIPDNVQESPRILAERLSPTNLGFLLNARQAACVLGAITPPELATLTRNTLDSVDKLLRFEGHLYNWYDNLTLKPLNPLFVSTVDNGNLVASLWSLKQGLLDQVRQPIISPVLRESIADQIQLLRDMGAITRKQAWQLPRATTTDDGWVSVVLKQPDTWSSGSPRRAASDEAVWWLAEIRKRLQALRRLAADYAPWLLPENAALLEIPELALNGVLAKLTPRTAGVVYSKLDKGLQSAIRAGASTAALDAMARVKALLPDCRRNAEALSADLHGLAERAEIFTQQMNFSILFDTRRKLLTVGYDAGANQPERACYDLMASEARIAAFVAIAKGEIPQESWFRLGRTHTNWEGETLLASWTGTMFEYLMPALWMNLYPNTMLDRSARAALRVQQIYAYKYRTPWGISESAWSEQNAEGHYQYLAFGIPSIALKGGADEVDRLVISPYSAWLAMMVNPEAALRNLSRMARHGWSSPFGFYESVDYGPLKRQWFPWRKGVIVRMWMAHHQGMSLLAMANWLGKAPFINWFHADTRVQATELLLQEKPLRAKPLPSVRPDLARLAHVHRLKTVGSEHANPA
jgi:hypothetical protein